MVTNDEKQPQNHISSLLIISLFSFAVLTTAIFSLIYMKTLHLENRTIRYSVHVKTAFGVKLIEHHLPSYEIISIATSLKIVVQIDQADLIICSSKSSSLRCSTAKLFTENRNRLNETNEFLLINQSHAECGRGTNWRIISMENNLILWQSLRFTSTENASNKSTPDK